MTDLPNNLPDPGPPPYCPKCGSRLVGVPQGSAQGVCMGCGSHLKPVLIGYDEERKPVIGPFLEELSELAVHPKPCIELAQQVRAKIRQEQQAREVMAERNRLA